MNLKACRLLERGPLTGTWYRAIEPQHWPTALQTSHTSHYTRRFNYGTAAEPGVEILYLAENALVALLEAEALFSFSESGEVLSHPRKAWLLLNVEVRLQQVVDLTEVSEQNKLDVSAQELTGDWRGYRQRGPATSVTEPTGLAPTQQLGAALFKVRRLEAFQTISAKLPYHRNQVVFPEKLLPSSRVEFHHPATGQKHAISGRR